MKKILLGVVCVAVFLVFFTINSYAQNEQLIITTYYPSPSGSYHELGADKLAVNVSGDINGNVVAVASEFNAMQVGDAHVGWSMMIGSGGGSGWAYDEMTTAGETLPGDGDVRIKGTVGVGTREPSTVFEVEGANTAGMGLIYADGTDDGVVTANAPTAGQSGFMAAKAGTGEWVMGVPTSVDRFHISEGDNVDVNVRLSVEPGGNVGIGIDDPGSRLHVNHNIIGTAVGPGTPPSADQVALWVENTASPSHGLFARTPAGASMHSLTGDGNALVAINNSDSYNTIYARNLSGTTPGVMPAIIAWGPAAIWAQGEAGGTGAWNAASDIRLKKNIESMDSVLEKVVKLNPVTFEWKEGGAGGGTYPAGKQIGLVAQEVEKIFPELTGQVQDGYSSIQYGKLSTILVEAIKEQQQEIEGLRKEIKDLNSRIK